MGFSTSGATAIVFVGLLIAVGMAYPVIQTAHEDRQAAIQDRDDRALDARNTAIDLAEVSYDAEDEAFGGEATLTVNATNDGSTVLSVPATDLLIDGDYVEDDRRLETTVADDADRELWQPGERLSIVASVGDAEAPARAKLVTEHGIAATETEIEEVT